MAWKKLYIQPNKAAQKAAKRGLEARRKAPKSKKGGLDAVQASMAGVGSGVLRARDIVAGKRVNAYQVNAFFNRHRNNYVNASIEGLKPVESRAIQAWLLWGGEPLRKQAAAAVRKDKAKRNPAENTSRDPARMSDEDLQAELDSAVGRVGEAVHQTEWEQEPEYVLGYEPSGRVIYKSSPGERFPKTLEGPPHDYTPEQYRERLRRYYDIFQEIRSRPHLSVVGIWWDETSHFLQGKSGGDEDLIEFVNGWKNDQILEHEFSRDRENEELKIRQEAQAIIENRSSKQEEYRKHFWGQVRALPGIREDAFGNPIARSVARRNRRAKRNPTGRKFKFDELSEAEKSRLIEEDFKYTRFRFKGDLDDQEVRFDIAKRALRHFERLIEHYEYWGGPPEGASRLPEKESVLYSFYESGVISGSWETRFDLPIQGYERIEEVDALLSRVADQVGTGGAPLSDRVTAGGRKYKDTGFGERFTYVPVSAVPLLVQALEILHDTREYTWDIGRYEVDEFRGHRKRGELGEPPGLPPARTYGPFEGNPIARSVARRNRRAKRNPIDTRDPTDDEIEDQAAAISRLLGETARNSEDHPHEVDLPQTRRAWKMYKSLEKEKESRIAKRNRKAKRNPDHIIDLDERRRKAEVERIFGSPEDPDFFEGLDFEDLDPVEESTSAIMDSVDDYCRVRGNPRRYNPSIERGGKISYGEYYGLPDGDGGYDLYYKDAIIASGVDTVEQAEEEISQHLESL